MNNAVQETKIGDITYKVAPFKAMRALRLKSRLLSISGAALGEILGSLSGNSLKDLDNININGDQLANGIARLFEHLQDDELENLIIDLLQGVVFVGKGEGLNRMISFDSDFEIAMDYCFQTRLMDLYKLIGFVLKVNYPDFFAPVLKVFRNIGSQINLTNILNESEEALRTE